MPKFLGEAGQEPNFAGNFQSLQLVGMGGIGLTATDFGAVSWEDIESGAIN
jgi:hypothetical protein